MAKKTKRISVTVNSLKRHLRKTEQALQDQISRTNQISVQLFDNAQRWANFQRDMSAKNVEIGRLQGYIDRVMDESRQREGRPVSGPSNPITAMREAVTERRDYGSVLDEMSTDDIERITGRDDG